AKKLLKDAGTEANHGAHIGSGQNGNGNGLNGAFADEEVGEILTKAYGVVRDGLNSVDREELTNLLAEKGGMSREEANKTLEKWERIYREAKQKYQQAIAQAEQAAREAADATATAISRVAGWTFVS